MELREGGKGKKNDKVSTILRNITTVKVDTIHSKSY
jgi:hypothetical protein